MKNMTAYMVEPKTLYFKEIPCPKPAAHEAVIQIECCGICGSDVHYYEHGRIGDYVVNGEFTLGHEVSGIVAAVGSAVTNLKAGDRVTLEPGIGCGHCEMCKTGKYNLCPDVIFFATPPVQGALQNFVTHPADMCFKLPDTVSLTSGALVEPLCVGLHACKQGGVTLGQSVVILGAGCIGLVTLLAAKAFGAANVIVVDLFTKRLEYAKQLGANHVVDASTEDVVTRVNELLHHKGADVVIEAAGSPKTIYQTSFFAKHGGTVVLTGIPVDSDLQYNFGQVMSKELEIKSVFRYRNLYPTAIAAIADGTINVEQIVTHRFSFADAKNALDTVIADAHNVVKGIITFS